MSRQRLRDTRPNPRVFGRALVALALMLVAHGGYAQEASRHPEVAEFLDEMSARHGFDRAELDRSFARVSFASRIVRLMDRQAEPKPWSEYRALFVNRQKLERGVRFWRENESNLELARRRYGVPEEILVAILGIETSYGKNVGSFSVLEALTTLAFDYPRREKLFRRELEHFLLLSREEGLPLERPRGSYAGAMGIPQFMPGSYRRYAIDFDGDSSRNLFESVPDAIGSVANYLTAHGWRRDAPIAAPAVVPAGGEGVFDGARLSTRRSLEELRRDGVSVPGAYQSEERVIPLTLRNEDSAEFWVGFDNFYVITRYNRSVYYAMAVLHLAQELRRQNQQTTSAGEPQAPR